MLCAFYGGDPCRLFSVPEALSQCLPSFSCSSLVLLCSHGFLHFLDAVARPLPRSLPPYRGGSSSLPEEPPDLLLLQR